jgi:hypothetical protein
MAGRAQIILTYEDAVLLLDALEDYIRRYPLAPDTPWQNKQTRNAIRALRFAVTKAMLVQY